MTQRDTGDLSVKALAQTDLIPANKDLYLGLIHCPQCFTA